MPQAFFTVLLAAVSLLLLLLRVVEKVSGACCLLGPNVVWATVLMVRAEVRGGA